MFRCRCEILLCVLFLIIVFPSLAAPRHRVLIISSYNSGFPTYFDQIEGFKSVFDTAGIIFDIESMDSKRFVDEQSSILFYQTVEHKIRNSSAYDAVVATDDNAFNFVLNRYDELFSGIPVVFCSVNNIKKAKEQNDNPNVTGIVEAVSMEETIDLMLDLFPSETIHAIVDSTPSGQADLESFLFIGKNYAGVNFNVIPMHTMFLHDFKLFLGDIPANEPVLLLSAYHDSTYSMLDFHYSMESIASSLNAPLFHLWYHGFNEGVLGGKIISQKDQAKQAALIVSEILSGKDVSEIPVVVQSPNVFVFDQNQLDRFGILSHQLPPEAILLNTELTFFSKHRQLFYIVIPVFIILILMVSILSLNIIRRKRAEKNLREQNAIISELNKKYRKQNESLQRANDDLKVATKKAEESDQLKTAFLANLSHEIRTPMNGIIGFTSLLSTPGLSPEKQQQFVHVINKSGNRMLNTVNDIIDVSRIQAGQVSVVSRTFNLKREMDDLCDTFLQEIDQKGLSIIINNELPVQAEEFYSDSGKINSVVGILIKNAIKFTHSGTITVNFAKNKDVFQVSVSDTGIGIPKDRQEDIFQPFVQADIADKSCYEGSGLGLAIAKSYVDMLNGKIVVESQPGMGSGFVVNFPWETNNGQKENTMTNNLKNANYKILIAEDDEVSYEAFTISLKDYSREFLWAKDGKETVSLAKENRDIDIILMDIKMPLMDGLQATKAIREFNPSVFIIAQTAYALAHDEQKALDAGCDAYISKPIDFKRLKNIIEQKLKK